MRRLWSRARYGTEGGTAYFLWYLDVEVVDSVGNGVPMANVSAAYPNAELAEAKTTDASGWTTLTLMEKMVNFTGEYPVGDYTVEAVYDIYSNSTALNMMIGNQQITLALQSLVIPEFPSLLILPFFMIATLMAIIVLKRRHSVKARAKWESAHSISLREPHNDCTRSSSQSCR